MSVFLPRRKISGPKNALTPGMNLTVGHQFARENCFACNGIYQRELLRMILRGPHDNGLFLRVSFITDLIYENMQLSKAGGS